MDDSVDKQLADHVRQTLESYQMPYQPGAWEQFDRARQPAKQRLGAWYRYVAAACVLGGMLLAPLWLEDARLPSPPMYGSVANRFTQPGRASAPEKQLSPLPAVSVPSSNEPVATISQRETRNYPTHAGALTHSVPVRISHNPSSRIAFLAPTTEIKAGDRTGKFGADSLSAVDPSTTVTSDGPTKSGSSESGQVPTAPIISGTASTQTTLMSVATALAMNETTTPNKERERRRAVTWSVALAPQTAYIPNGRSSLTLGGGVVSDIALNQRFSVSTGLAVAQQTVGIARPANQVMTTLGRQLTATNARFVLIDLPLNLTYQVGRQTRPLFRVSAGLSSLAFLHQHYADTYQTLQTRVTQVIDLNGHPQIVQQTTLTETVETRPLTPFGGIYWGRLLNLSVGIERPLSRRLVVGIEPYLKYPIGPLTGADLSIGSAGVSMRVGIR